MVSQEDLAKVLELLEPARRRVDECEDAVRQAEAFLHVSQEYVAWESAVAALKMAEAGLEIVERAAFGLMTIMNLTVGSDLLK